MPDKWDPFVDVGSSGTKNKTMIEPDKVMAAISKFPDIEEDLKKIETKLKEISEPLEATWIGTARGAYVRVEFYVKQEIQKDETKIANLHLVETQACAARKLLDLGASIAATINSN